ncbi:extracellular solute-binding protein [Cohnella zeiphila]|uniref:extracellular solute-binding protein n=1 Tax=Cohnella zeiphila TaxID=2761120 RepID=UPI001EE15D40|nr:extracellular solute-binding protein [Cohnella zeiphila]
MKKKSRVFAACMVVFAVALAGCSSSNQPESSASSGAAGSPSNGAGDKKIAVSAMDFFYGDVPPADGRGVKMIDEKFNIDYQINFIPQANYDDKLATVLASGKIPDIVSFQGGDLTNRYHKFAKQGAFAALDDYIKDYPTFQRIPASVLDQFRVDGKLYAIPQYYPRFGFTTVVRKDWLDNLGLQPPASYEELKQVALAFTKNDPDRNGKNDTYGMAMGASINPAFAQGPYWDPTAWYHKDDQGRFIPGLISNARKDVIQMYADLFKEGAITRDMATLNWADTNKEFYSGKAGIFIGTPRGMSQAYMEGLLAIDPGAEFVALDMFQAPDGSKGMLAGRGFLGITTISAEAGKDPAKVKRILDMIDYGRQFFPDDQKNDKNPDFDWLNGNVGQGYDMADGRAVLKSTAGTEGLYPQEYFVDSTAWPEKDTDVNYPADYSNPKLSQLTSEIMKNYSAMKYYTSPNNRVVSETELAKGADLTKYLYDEQTKMIAGQRPVSDWDKMVEEWKAMGGEQLIQEINANIRIKDAKEGWSN